MELLNIEIKAKCSQLNEVRRILKKLKAELKGIDHQIDTYFKVPRGRLKLREGEIEKCLIYYQREDSCAPKQSKIILYKYPPNSALKEILTSSLGVLVIVDKIREIYFIDNVKFHLDNVKYLGTFIEIEAIDSKDTLGKEKLQKQCKQYMKKLNIKNSDLIAFSYSDMI